MLKARSTAETWLYLELHGCECGVSQFEPEHWLESRDGALVAVYQGSCPACGTRRRIEFSLADAQEVPAPAIGGETPSEIIDAGEFLLLSDRAAASVPVDLSGLTDRQLAVARERMTRAIVALQEVMKFIPSGADQVPESALRVADSRALYREHPERFTRTELNTRLRSYREGMLNFAS